jgi:hypothetical protein
MVNTHEDRDRSIAQPGERPHETIEIRLTDGERIEYQKAAERCGLSLADWIHDRLDEALRREAKEA